MDIAPKSASGIFVRLGPDHDTADVRRLLKNTSLAKRSYSVSRVGPEGLFHVETKTRLALSSAWPIARQINSLPDVDYAEVDVVIPGLEDPESIAPARRGGGGQHKACSKPCEWSVKETHADSAWTVPGSKKRFGSGIRIGHPDTGYTRHFEINDPQRLLSKLGYDFKSKKKDPKDPLTKPNAGHGTGTASVIMSAVGPRSDSPEFVSGTAPKAELVPFRVSQSVVHFDFGNVTKAIYRSVEAGCHVISMSLGGPFYSRALDDAVRYAQREGLIVLSAAGNVWPFVVYPARLDSVIAVAATNCRHNPWKNSASGRSVDISAPGESVWRARVPGKNNYTIERGNGTSFAVATTAGICALWLAHHGRNQLITRYGKENLWRAFRTVLKTDGFSVPDGWDSRNFGKGIVDADSLLRAALPATLPARRFFGTTSIAIQPNSIEEIASYTPDASPGRVAEVMQKTLGAKPDSFVELLDEFGDELRFHLASNPEFPRTVESRASTSRRSVRGVRGRTAVGNQQLSRQASRDLLRRLGAD